MNALNTLEYVELSAVPIPTAVQTLFEKGIYYFDLINSGERPMLPGRKLLMVAAATPLQYEITLPDGPVYVDPDKLCQTKEAKVMEKLCDTLTANSQDEHNYTLTKILHRNRLTFLVCIEKRKFYDESSVENSLDQTWKYISTNTFSPQEYDLEDSPFNQSLDLLGSEITVETQSRSRIIRALHASQTTKDLGEKSFLIQRINCVSGSEFEAITLVSDGNSKKMIFRFNSRYRPLIHWLSEQKNMTLRFEGLRTKNKEIFSLKIDEDLEKINDDCMANNERLKMEYKDSISIFSTNEIHDLFE